MLARLVAVLGPSRWQSRDKDDSVGREGLHGQLRIFSVCFGWGLNLFSTRFLEARADRDRASVFPECIMDSQWVRRPISHSLERSSSLNCG